MRFFRPKVIVSRLMLFGLVLIFTALAARPILQSAVERSLQTVTGTWTRAAEIRTSFRESRIQLVDLKVADPHQSKRDLLRADLVDITLDRSSLLRRELHIRRGQVTGLELVADIDSTPAIKLEPAITAQQAMFTRFDRVASHWFPGLDGASDGGVGTPSEFASVALAEELLRRWPGENETLETRAKELMSQTAAIRDLIQSVGENPLRNTVAYQQAINDLEGLGREFYEIRRKVEQVRAQMAMDRNAVTAARAKELAVAREQGVAVAMNDDELSTYLLGAEVIDEVNMVLKWVQLSRRYTPVLTAQFASHSQRGERIPFGNQAATPRVFIDTLVVRGTGLFGAKAVTLEGTVQNLSSNPRRMAEPTEITLQTSGDVPLLIQARTDASGPRAVDRIVFDCPKLPQPRRLLGNPNQLALVVGPGKMHVWASLEIVGESLRGEVVLKQTQPEVSPSLHARFGGSQVAEAISQNMPPLESLDIAVDIQGSLVSPTWTLRSNLGSHLASSVEQAIRSEIFARREQRVLEAHEKIDAQVQSIERAIAAKQQAILDSLRFGAEEVEGARKDIASRLPHADQSPHRDSILR